jgi:nucleoside-diphosphate kinase
MLPGTAEALRECPSSAILAAIGGCPMQRTMVILKPNTVQRELVGELISRFERRGIKIIAMKMSTISNEQAMIHYREHREKSFYSGLIEFITSGPSILLVLESEDAVAIVRAMSGNTNPADALPGTIRGDFATSPGHNMIHASDSEASAHREIELFFDASELQDYRLTVRPWL